MHPAQVDNEPRKEHLRNFVVNALDDELSLDLGENVEITTDELYEDLNQSHLQDDRRLAPRQYRPWPSHRPVQA